MNSIILSLHAWGTGRNCTRPLPTWEGLPCLSSRGRQEEAGLEVLEVSQDSTQPQGIRLHCVPG